MEDAHVVHFSPSGDAYFGVLDGHGGSACSEWCAVSEAKESVD